MVDNHSNSTFSGNIQVLGQSIHELKNPLEIWNYDRRPYYDLGSSFNVSVLKPISNGTNTEIPSENPQGSIHWQLVSDTNDSTYVIEDYSSATAYTDTYQSQNLTSISGIINAISINIRVRTSITFANARAWTVVLLNDTEFLGPVIEPSNDWNNFTTNYETNPSTFAKWTWNEINTMEIGVMLRALPQEGRECWCSEVWAEVNYTQTFDNSPPEIINNGVDDFGNGTGYFWANVTDSLSSVDNVNITINGTEYSMINNGSFWIYPYSVAYNCYYEFQITNASDSNGNYISSPSNISFYKFETDLVAPIVDTPVYYSTVGDNGTFYVNVSDPWGEIDIIIVNITVFEGIPQNNLWMVMLNTSSGYMADGLAMIRGNFQYIIIANDTKDNLGTSNEINSSVPNHCPEVTELQLSSDQDQLKIPIYSNNTLFLHYSFYDRDSDSEGGSQIRWYKNEVLQPIHNDSHQISAPYLTKNDQWFATVRPRDGQDFGDIQISDSITIQNVPPSVHNYSFVFNPNTSQINPDIRSTLLDQVFFVEDETISIIYDFKDVDHPLDYDQSTIRWFKRLETGYWEEDLTNQNKTFLPSSKTSSGEYWKCMIIPFDGTGLGKSVNLSVIYIESRPCILSHNMTPIIFDDDGLYINEGKYLFQVEASCANPINSVEFILNDSSKVIYYAQRNLTNNSIWFLEYLISPTEFYDNFLNTVLTINVTICSCVNFQNQEFMICGSYTFSFVVEDRCPPRVVGNPSFTFNDELNPTNITFNADIIDYGSGIEDVTLFYYFEEITDNETNMAGMGANFKQKDVLNWQIAKMSLLSVNTINNVHSYSVTVSFGHGDSSRAILFYIKTTDKSGNTGIPYNILNDPEKIREFHFDRNPRSLNPFLLLIGIITIISTISGSAIYLKVYKKPKLYGFNKELVFGQISEIDESKSMEFLDVYTLGVVTSFFDQNRGPIPIIVTPEIIKDNFTKLIELSDRSFGGLGFMNNFEGELVSNFDFLLSKDRVIKSLSFGFALNRPEARGGKENLTLNILIYPDLFPVVIQFLEEIQEKVHIIHQLLNNQNSDKDMIRTKIIEIRKFISSILLAYERIYGTSDRLLT